MNKLTYPLFDSVVDSIWLTIPNYINWLSKQRKRKVKISGINLTIILHSATLIEGFLYDVLEEEIGFSEDQSSLENRLYNELYMKLQAAAWTNYISLFELITNKKLLTLTDNETWKGITMMFQLRNMVTHGKSIEITIDKQKPKEHTVNKKYTAVISYLNEIGIRSPDLPVPTTPLLSDESADHFYKLTVKFIGDIHANYLIPKNGQSWDAYEIAFL